MLSIKKRGSIKRNLGKDRKVQALLAFEKKPATDNLFANGNDSRNHDGKVPETSGQIRPSLISSENALEPGTDAVLRVGKKRKRRLSSDEDGDNDVREAGAGAEDEHGAAIRPKDDYYVPKKNGGNLPSAKRQKTAQTSVRIFCPDQDNGVVWDKAKKRFELEREMGRPWARCLEHHFKEKSWRNLTDFLAGELASRKRVFPPVNEIFATFKRTPPSAVRVVIIGQDPYHGPGQAHGFCFSVRDGVRVPPSLVNIFHELELEYGPGDSKRFLVPGSGNLERWAKQGVFLLNSVLTVLRGSPGSHARRGWEQFTDEVIRRISRVCKNVVFMLWGGFAKKKRFLVENVNSHCILMSSHPSPLSARRGFNGCGHFRAANDYLRSKGLAEIDWRLADPKATQSVRLDYDEDALSGVGDVSEMYKGDFDSAWTGTDEVESPEEQIKKRD